MNIREPLVTDRDRDPAIDFVNGWCDQAWSTAADKLSKIIARARAEGFAAGVAQERAAQARGLAAATLAWWASHNDGAVAVSDPGSQP